MRMRRCDGPRRWGIALRSIRRSHAHAREWTLAARGRFAGGTLGLPVPHSLPAGGAIGYARGERIRRSSALGASHAGADFSLPLYRSGGRLRPSGIDRTLADATGVPAVAGMGAERVAAGALTHYGQRFGAAVRRCAAGLRHSGCAA